MDVRERLNLLGEAARYDDCSASAPDVVAEGRGFFASETSAAADPRVLPCISHLRTPSGQRKATPKLLQTSAGQNDCRYCAFRAGRDMCRVHLGPHELARSFDLMYRAGSRIGGSRVGQPGSTDTRDAGRARAQLQTLVIDEGFGSQDSQGRSLVVEVISSIQHDFERIIVITHIEELKGLFPARIDVVKTASGSRVVIT